MTIITNEYGQRVLVPADGKWLLAVGELELPEEKRNYTKAVYIADVLTLEDTADKWEEIDEPKEVE